LVHSLKMVWLSCHNNIVCLLRRTKSWSLHKYECLLRRAESLECQAKSQSLDTYECLAEQNLKVFTVTYKCLLCRIKSQSVHTYKCLLRQTKAQNKISKVFARMSVFLAEQNSEILASSYLWCNNDLRPKT
jgi:hypothetical protein